MSNAYKVSLNDERDDDDNANKPLLPNEGTGGTELNRTADDSMNSEVDSLISDGYEFKQTSYRWVICLLFMCNFIGRSISMVGFSSVAKILIEAYPIDSMHITMLVIPFSFMVLFFLIPYNYISIHYGLKIPTYMAVITTIIGVWIRILVNDSFYWVILGQCIIAIGQPLTLVAPAKIAAIWFGDNQRALATTIGSLAGPVGSVLGFLLPFAFLGDSDAVDSQSTRDKVRNYIIFQSVLVTALSVPIAFFVRTKPEVAPSISALQSLHARPESTWTSMKKLAQNRDYMLLIFAFSGIFAVYVCFGAVMGPLMAQFEYEASANQYFGSSYVVFGVLGSFVHAGCLDKHKKYKFQFLFICVTNLICTFTFAFFAKYHNVPLTTALVALFGASQLPIIGVGYQFATELTYPINENAAIGMLQLVNCFLGIIFTFFTTYLVKHEYKYLAAYSLALPGVLSLLVALFIRERLNKHRLSIIYNEQLTRSSMASVTSDLDK